MEQRSPRRIRHWLLYGAYLVTIVTILSELSLRFLEPRSESLKILLYQSDNQPNKYHEKTVRDLMARTPVGYHPGRPSRGFFLNSRGLRTPEYETKKAPGTYRVVALGDSFTFTSAGVPWDHHYPVAFSRGLSEAWKRPVELVNLAAPAVGPSFYLRMWQVEGIHLQADLVLMGIYVGNDFKSHGVKKRRKAEPVSAKLVRLSYLARWIRNIDRLRSAIAFQPAVGATSGRWGTPDPQWKEQYDPLEPTFTHEEFLRSGTFRALLCRIDETERFEYLWERLQPTLESLHASIRASGARLLVLIIPSQYQVDPTILSEIAESEGLGIDAYDLDRPQRTLAAFFNSAGIEFVDVLQASREHPSDPKKPLYKAGNSHWSIYGADLATEHLLAYMRRHPSP